MTTPAIVPPAELARILRTMADCVEWSDSSLGSVSYHRAGAGRGYKAIVMYRYGDATGAEDLHVTGTVADHAE